MKARRRVVHTLFDEDAYQATGNGLHAWIAYREARKRGGLPPEWVWDYFDRCYQALKAPGGTASPKRIAKALQLDTARGGQGAQGRAITARRHLAVVTHIRAYRRLATPHGQKITQQLREDIFDRVATESGYSADHVEKIWNEFRRKSSKRLGT